MAVDRQAALARLRAEYLGSLAQRMSPVDGAAASLDELGLAALGPLRRAVHGLAGSGATFGFPRISSVARELEELADAIMARGLAPDREARDRLNAQIGLLRAAVAEAAATPAPAIGQRLPDPALRPDRALEPGTVYLCPSVAAEGEAIAVTLGHHGFTVRTFLHPADLETTLTARRPSALVIDLDFCADVGILRGATGEPVAPILFISGRSDSEARLEAVRAGGLAFFAKPVDIDGLLERLDRCLDPPNSDPFRVVIVDDDSNLANAYSAFLEDANMIVSATNDPLSVLGAATGFDPDLFLMDLHMPTADGTEVARMIRQHSALARVPILFASGEASIVAQVAARALGGDDFLLKPLQQTQLVSAVTSRVLRYRELKRMIDSDGLTGLLNHTRIAQRIAAELETARRAGGKLSMAMIDIDHFKSVNDRHGHLAGDAVLRTLGRLLRQRLRRTDVAGRHGGEEFSVMLPGAEAGQAARVIDGLRHMFKAIQHAGPHGTFAATFSAGIAACPPFAAAHDLVARADAALYRAKKGGRNQVVIDDGDAIAPS